MHELMPTIRIYNAADLTFQVEHYSVKLRKIISTIQATLMIALLELCTIYTLQCVKGFIVFG